MTVAAGLVDVKPKFELQLPETKPGERGVSRDSVSPEHVSPRSPLTSPLKYQEVSPTESQDEGTTASAPISP